MFYKEPFYFSMFASVLLVITVAYSNTTTEKSLATINKLISSKKIELKKDKKSIKYALDYDELARLILLKNKILFHDKKYDDIDNDKICDFALKYENIEFIKTKYYNTPFKDDVAKTLKNIAQLYQYCLPQRAQVYMKSVTLIKKNIYGVNSEEYASSIDDLADCLINSDDKFTDAILYYRKAKDIREKLYDINDYKTTKNYKKLALAIYYHSSYKKEAKKLLLRALEIRKNDKKCPKKLLYNAKKDIEDFYQLIGLKGKY